MDPQDEGTTPSTDETPTPPEGNEPEGAEKDAEIPADVLRANLTKANQEAARYRTSLREAEKALEAAKTPEQVEELLNGLRAERETAERSLLIENVALKFSLPEELATVLQGSTREELEKHAATLAKFAPKPEGDEVPPGDLNGGLNPGNNSNDDGLSPRERYRKLKGYRN